MLKFLNIRISMLDVLDGAIKDGLEPFFHHLLRIKIDHHITQNSKLVEMDSIDTSYLNLFKKGLGIKINGF
jgi:hypothetical protein